MTVMGLLSLVGSTAQPNLTGRKNSERLPRSSQASAKPMTATNDGGRIVDGATRLYCIIGDPVAQTGSPRVFSERFRAAGRNAILVPFHVPSAAFEPIVRGIMALANLDGIIVTVPYKARMLQFVDRILPTAQKIGAVNALRRDPDGRWSGDMFDGRGMVRGLAGHGHTIAGRNAMLIGAGGAGSAIACALAQAGAASITLADIDRPEEHRSELQSR